MLLRRNGVDTGFGASAQSVRLSPPHRQGYNPIQRQQLAEKEFTHSPFSIFSVNCVSIDLYNWIQFCEHGPVCCVGGDLQKIDLILNC